jgi:hypothetical protein
MGCTGMLAGTAACQIAAWAWGPEPAECRGLPLRARWTGYS